MPSRLPLTPETHVKPPVFGPICRLADMPAVVNDNTSESDLDRDLAAVQPCLMEANHV